jgi:hypothetical protein
MWRTWGNYQHHLAARACVFVVPMAPVNGHFSKLTPAGLASFLREIAAVITPMARSSPPDVGDVALSGFSGGCQWLPHLLSQSRNPASAAFLNDNVKELYLFDSAVTDANNLAPLLPQFLRQGETGKVVRSYTRFSATHAAIAPHVSTHPRDRRSVSFPQGTAVEVHSARGSSIFIPETLLIKGCTQTKDCRIPIPDLSGQNWAHDWFVRFFMAHALRFSVFRPLPEPPPEEGLDRAQSPSL